MSDVVKLMEERDIEVAMRDGKISSPLRSGALTHPTITTGGAG
jgi:hypothetical protein